jgi:hypothetical protein
MGDVLALVRKIMIISAMNAAIKIVAIDMPKMAAASMILVL